MTFFDFGGYFQIIQNRREGTKSIQRVVATIGRMDQIQEKKEIENLVRSFLREEIEEQ